jgi:murein DD-endopeptidase MepM/ murein hydrolase activator NlpD
MGWSRSERLAVGLAVVLSAPPNPALAQRGLGPAVELRIPVPPTPFRGGDSVHLIYEVHATNFGPATLELRRLEVLDDGDGHVLLTYADSALTANVGRPGPRPDRARMTSIGAGLRAVVYVMLTVPTAAEVPGRLRHRLTFGRGDSAGSGPPEAIEGLGVTPGGQPLLIGPPLRGSNWLAANGPGNRSGHRRTLIPIGTAAVAQRFAIDWLKIDEQGRTFTGDRTRNANFHAYGVDLLAVADAVVVDVKDGIPENDPTNGRSRAVPITLETVGGNYVVLDLGGGRYGFYAHIQPGSMRVKVGDRVRRGQALALLGNSGNSTEPHLHFHVMDGPSPLGSEGLPYEIDGWEQAGLRSQGGGGVVEPGRPRRNQLPMQNEIAHFP